MTEIVLHKYNTLLAAIGDQLNKVNWVNLVNLLLPVMDQTATRELFRAMHGV